MPPDINPSRIFTIGQVSLTAPPQPSGLYLVSTPIGNLGDVTLRALETLAGCDLIACEDTRTSGVLLSRYGISKPKTSYNEHNAEQKGQDLLRQLKDGRAIALISDAGTPLVSDPGFRLVGAAIEAAIPVIPVPGASAPMAALIASGLPGEQFVFCGFLPGKQGARKRRLAEFGSTNATLVFFESPKRLSSSLADMCEIFGQDRACVVARELTKLHETFYRGSLGEISKNFTRETPPKGEIVILVDAASSRLPDDRELDNSLKELLKELPTRTAAAVLAEQTGISKRTLYQRALKIGKDHG